MITLEKLSASVKPQIVAFQEVRCITSAVHVEIAPGCFMHVLLSQDGLVIGHGDARVAVPLGELVTLALLHEPRLVPELAQPGLNIGRPQT